MYRTVPHTADMGLLVEAPDLGSLFAEAGQGLFSIIVADLETVEARVSEPFTLDACEIPYLLVDWLTELLFAFESRRLLFREFEVSIDAGGLKATARGEPVDESRHQLQHEVKAITYHALNVEHRDDKWIATVVVDI
jgi:SHS2 domain-containing protein